MYYAVEGSGNGIQKLEGLMFTLEKPQEGAEGAQIDYELSVVIQEGPKEVGNPEKLVVGLLDEGFFFFFPLLMMLVHLVD